jgi:deoxyhypusine synthase
MTSNKQKTLKQRCQELMSGQLIDPLILPANKGVKEFIDQVYARSGFNGRRLAEACRLFTRMIEEDATIGLTLSGAMTPIGMSGVIVQLIEKGFVDFIITTGANLYHDLHRPFGYPVVQGEVEVDDEMLHDCGIARIYDTFIYEDETILATDRVIQGAVRNFKRDRPISSADLHYRIGTGVLVEAENPEWSFLAVAAKSAVPIYTPSPGDSGVGMNAAMSVIFEDPVVVDPSLDILEATALVWKSPKNGVIIVGGGAPKNFYMQTQPMLWQFLDNDKGGHDYFIQLTVDSPHWGGLSGATPSEAKSWGKIQVGQEKNTVVVYSCASLTFPLLAQYVLASCRPRPLKRLYDQKDQALRELRDATLERPRVRERFSKLFGD